jgi:hypothetical protein
MQGKRSNLHDLGFPERPGPLFGRLGRRKSLFHSKVERIADAVYPTTYHFTNYNPFIRLIFLCGHASHWVIDDNSLS